MLAKWGSACKNGLMEAYRISTPRYCLEAFRAQFSNRSVLGKLALKAGGAVGALTAAGVAILGAAQFNEAINPEPVLVGNTAPSDVGKQLGYHLHNSIEQAQEDFTYSMGAWGAFSVLLASGIGLIAYGSSRRRSEPAVPITEFYDMPDPDLTEDIDPSSTLVIHNPQTSLADEIFDGGPY
ncbi:MAG TPA: hypothetical protein VFT16_02355 [Candidatus Saccharimonadales bacterium]|nr:hypothetical protein [Candidatus Saccharimonadales bacterium]